MGSRIQKRWPKNANNARELTIDHARAALTLIDQARDKLSRREHQALIALDMSDAARYLEIIIRLMEQAKNGIQEEA